MSVALKNLLLGAANLRREHSLELQIPGVTSAVFLRPPFCHQSHGNLTGQDPLGRRTEAGLSHLRLHSTSGALFGSFIFIIPALKWGPLASDGASEGRSPGWSAPAKRLSLGLVELLALPFLSWAAPRVLRAQCPSLLSVTVINHKQLVGRKGLFQQTV